jgi:hypothetical protein
MGGEGLQKCHNKGVAAKYGQTNDLAPEYPCGACLFFSPVLIIAV